MAKTNGVHMRLILGQSIKHFRTAAGLTQEQLAERCETTGDYLGEIERGEKWPSSETLEMLAGQLGVMPFHLFQSGDRSTMSENFDGDTVIAFTEEIRRRVDDTINEVKREFIQKSRQ